MAPNRQPEGSEGARTASSQIHELNVANRQQTIHPAVQQCLAMVEPYRILYTDGGAKPNPGPGGWGVVIVDPATSRIAKELSGAEAGTTNNRMELTAAIRGLESFATPKRIQVVTDSSYVRLGITRWLRGWVRNHWRRPTGEPVLNADLWRRLDELNRRHQVSWQWIKGHAGQPHNERADELATLARQELSTATEGEPPGSAHRGRESASQQEAEPSRKIFLRVRVTPRRGYWQALVRDEDGERTLHGQLANKTANQADLEAAHEILSQFSPGSRIAFFTPSDYLRQGATEWLAKWRRNRWRTQSGQSVKNVDLWRSLAHELERLDVSWPQPPTDCPELEALRKQLQKPASA